LIGPSRNNITAFLYIPFHSHTRTSQLSTNEFVAQVSCVHTTILPTPSLSEIARDTQSLPLICMCMQQKLHITCTYSIYTSIQIDNDIDGSDENLSGDQYDNYHQHISISRQHCTARRTERCHMCNSPIHSNTSPCLLLPCSLNTASKSAMTSNLSVSSPTLWPISR
jgi:hypothetical protein